jgi:hypothetical protein
MCRDLRETMGGRYPHSTHAPACEDYVTEEFARIEYDDVACVMEKQEAEAFVDDSNVEYVVTTVRLTRDQFERMAEFAGF